MSGDTCSGIETFVARSNIEKSTKYVMKNGCMIIMFAIKAYTYTRRYRASAHCLYCIVNGYWRGSIQKSGIYPYTGRKN